METGTRDEAGMARCPEVLGCKLAYQHKYKSVLEASGFHAIYCIGAKILKLQ